MRWIGGVPKWMAAGGAASWWRWRGIGRVGSRRCAEGSGGLPSAPRRYLHLAPSSAARAAAIDSDRDGPPLCEGLAAATAHTPCLPRRDGRRSSRIASLFSFRSARAGEAGARHKLRAHAARKAKAAPAVSAAAGGRATAAW